MRKKVYIPTQYPQKNYHQVNRINMPEINPSKNYRIFTESLRDSQKVESIVEVYMEYMSPTDKVLVNFNILNRNLAMYGEALKIASRQLALRGHGQWVHAK